MNELIFFETKIVGGIVGDALESGANAVLDGIIYGFQYVVLASAKIVGVLSGTATMGEEMIYFASKEGRDKGKIVKYFLIYVGAQIVGMMIRALDRG